MTETQITVWGKHDCYDTPTGHTWELNLPGEEATSESVVCSRRKCNLLQNILQRRRHSVTHVVTRQRDVTESFSQFVKLFICSLISQSSSIFSFNHHRQFNVNGSLVYYKGDWYCHKNLWTLCFGNYINRVFGAQTKLVVSLKTVPEWQTWTSKPRSHVLFTRQK